MDQTTAPGHTDSFAGTLLKRLRLNIRVLGLALRRRWLMPDDIGVSYDRLACGYDESWLIHLKTITDRLTARLNAPATSILDLGCGTGYTLAWATERYPRALITGVDISRGMLDMATQRAGPPVSLVRADMLDYLHNCRSGSFDLIVAAWSIGYSNPAEVIAEAGRILPAGGTPIPAVCSMRAADYGQDARTTSKAPLS